MRYRAIAFAILMLAGCGDGSDDSTVPGDPTTVVDVIAPTSAAPTTATPTTLGDADSPGVGATPRPPTTTQPTTPAEPPPTTPSIEVVHSVGTPTLVPPNPLLGSDGATGSGCSPGPGPLPDGVWIGLVQNHDTDSFDFDLVCLYFGDIAWEKAAAVGDEAPNDVFISNQSESLRRISIDRSTHVYWIVAPPDSALRFEIMRYADWAGDPSGYSDCPGEFCLVWLYVNNGDVTEIVEQYLP